jgi:hypothetical protein
MARTTQSKLAKSTQVYQLNVSLHEVKLPVLRRLLVPADVRLDRLHLVLQAVMGWSGAHYHQFRLGDLIFKTPGHESRKTLGADERTVGLNEILRREGAALTYEYDFGDLWSHELVLERVLDVPAKDARPVCIGGEGNCPPENCGGAEGYADLLAILSNPKHPKHRERKKWAGKDFRPEFFDLAAANRRLDQIS